jgi:phosphate starvation-inducible PhoH-like protein
LDTISDTKHITLEPYDAKRLANLCGQLDEHLRQIENRFNICIYNRGNLFSVTGESFGVSAALSVLDTLYTQTDASKPLTPEHIHLAIRERQMSLSESGQDSTKATPNKAEKASASAGKQLGTGQAERLTEGGICALEFEANPGQTIVRTGRTPIKARGATQQHYVKQIRNLDVNFGIGPAGTGKTFLAVACALEALDQGDVRKIILTRPAVEAGEKLGFLPGDMVEKVNPYLRPLYDALYEMLGFERINKYIDRQVIEIAPLAYMRGRTLNHAFIILDEAQNTTIQQMKMFLTRLGFGSKAVITGDRTQIDLPGATESGLRHAIQVLDGVDGLGFTYFKAQDVVRHSIVQAIVEAYDRAEPESQGNGSKNRRANRRRSSPASSVEKS